MKKIIFVISIVASMLVLCYPAAASSYEPFSNNVDNSYSRSATTSSYQMATTGSSYQGGYSVGLFDVKGDYVNDARNVDDTFLFGYDEMFKTDGTGEGANNETTGGGTGEFDTPLGLSHLLFAFLFVGYIFLLLRRKVKLTQHQ